jgi:hypothetical protein
LATYVQLRAAGRDRVDFPPGEWRPSEVRQRAYTIGPSLAFLLDRFAPGWQSALAARDAQFLDAMLATALEAVAATDSCDLPPAERAGIEARARDDAAAVVHDREARRRAFDALPGWRLLVTAAAGKPLWPQGFDPLNVDRTAGGLLHTRLLQLQNESGSVRMLDEAGADIEAVTAGAGPHPLFNGVQSVEVAGLARPSITRQGSKTLLRCAGLLADFDGAVVREDATAQRLEIHLAR